MKKFIHLFLLILVLSFFVSCEKDDIQQRSSIGEWVLTDAKLYIKRWGNHPWQKFDYFTPTQTTNCVDLTGNCFLLDYIELNKTKWTLPKEDGVFILNDTVVYEEQSNASSIRVFPIENGSARVYILDCLKDNYVRWKTSEREQALTVNGVTDNYTYYSTLIFKRVGTASQYEMCPDNPNLPTSGTVPTNNSYTNELAGEKWVIYKYKKQGFNSYEYISDTLYFINNYYYYYNSGIQQLGYGLFNMGNYYSMYINHTRFGSNITASNISKYSIENGDIQNVEFKDNTIGNNGSYYYIFMKKIQ
jgi:hypothetical protein